MSKKTLCAALCVLVSFIVHAQSWRDQYNDAQKLYDEDKLEDAFVSARQALEQYQQAGGAADAQEASLLRLLAVISYDREKYNEGLVFAESERSIRAAQKDTLYAGALTIVAQFQKQLGRHSLAIQSLTECHEVLLRYYTPTDDVVRDCDAALGVNSYLNNEQDAAYTYFIQALTTVGPNHDYSADMLEALFYHAQILLEREQVSEALAAFQQTRSLYESAGLQSTVNYPLIVFGLARTLVLAGKFDEAEREFEQAQQAYAKAAGQEEEDYFKIIRERSVNLHRMGRLQESEGLMQLIRQHPGAASVYAFSLADKAADDQEAGRYAEAEKLYQEALALYVKQDEETALARAEVSANLGMLYAEQGDTERAMAILTESRKVIVDMKAVASQKKVAIWSKTAWVMTLAGRYAEASDAYRQALNLLGSAATPSAEQRTVWTGLAELNRRQGMFNKSDSLNKLVLGSYPSGRHDQQYLRALNGQAASLQAQGKLAEVRRVLELALHETQAIHGPGTIPHADALETLALLHIRLGQTAAARHEIDSAVLIVEKLAGTKSRQYGNLMITRGRLSQALGDYTQAEPLFRDAREILRTTAGAESADYAVALNSLALLYQVMGNYAEARPLLQDARSIYEKQFGKINAEYATAVQNIATLCQLEGDWNQAEQLLKEVMAIDQKTLGEQHPQYGIALQNLATLYQKQGKLDEARQMLEKVLLNLEQALGKDHPTVATTISNLAALYQDKGDFVRAETEWKRSVELRKRILGEDHPDYARSLYGLAGVYHARGELDEARRYYEPVVAKYQKQVQEYFPSLSEKEKSAFYAKIKPVFDAYQDFCVQYARTRPEQNDELIQQLYDLQLSTKAILLNASNKVRVRIQESGDPALQAMFRQWLDAKELLVHQYNLSEAERKQSGVSVSELEQRANDLEKQLSARSDVFKSQFEKEVISWKQVQQVLQPEEAAIEIIRIKKKYVKDSVYYAALVLKPGDVKPALVVWPRGNQLEGRKFKYHRNTIKFLFRDSLSYDYYWKPLEGSLKGVKSIFFSCDGVFNKVNFNSLQHPDTRRYVIEDYTLHLLSNTRELPEGRSAATATERKASLFGYADFNLGEANQVSGKSKRNLGSLFGFEGANVPILPATEKEIDDIEQLLRVSQWKVSAYKKMEATEDNLKSLMNPAVLHIATHGFFLNDVDISEHEGDEMTTNPLFRSGVLLAGASALSDDNRREDGVLTAYEAMNLNLDQTDLVVLSACETGLGEIRNGEGVYGLQRSFLVAGSRTVLMSLWQVDDVATQELMNSFYAGWVKTGNMRDAFRQAQLEIKARYELPFYWGAFVLIGK